MKFSFTISTANYLAQAKVAGLSLLTHNPDFDFTIYLLDKINDRFNVNEFLPIQVIEIESLGLSHFEEMFQRYNAFELSNALKPFVAEYIFKKNQDVTSVTYIDSDIMVYASFTEIDELLISHNIIITPHLQSPLPLDGFFLDEKSFLNAGIYNGGFFVVKRSVESFKFLDWWKSRMRTQCFVDFRRGLFVDQIWLNLVPLYFSGVHILLHAGYNAAYWNLHERTISSLSDRHIINGDVPLVFFHFSGYRFHEPQIISRHQTRYTFNTKQEVVNLFKDYHTTVLSNGYEKFGNLKWHYQPMKEKHVPGPVTRFMRSLNKFISRIKENI